LNNDREAGVTIMQIDEAMDHGPLLAQTQVTIEKEDWPLSASELEDILAHEGGALLAYILPQWVAGEVPALPQDHDKGTYCSLIKKEDAELNLADDPYQNFLKIKAYNVWPMAYFFTERDGKKIRVKVTDATYINNTLTITRVIPEGKKEMRYEDFLRS
jgi:methionyl-tRNA formyltransferase